jgi:uncharacterized protein (DUF2336 family)
MIAVISRAVIAVMLEQSLLVEIEGAFTSGSSRKQAEILRRVTDLFLSGASHYSSEQVGLFDGVISRLAEKIEIKARAELATRLAPVENAPPATVRQLANDSAIEVAGPILRQSLRLNDEDLLTIASNEGQERLLAISKRATLNENISDVLVTRGDRDIVLSIARNAGARFSSSGYGRLVDRSIDDEVLAICVGARKDIPREHFHALISKASEAVFARLVASNPASIVEVQKVLTGITGQEITANRKAKRDYRKAEEQLDIMRRSGASMDGTVWEFAANGKFLETVVALAALAHAPRELVESMISDRRGDDDSVLILAKAGGLSWPTAKKICTLRRGPGGLPPQAIEAARLNFEKLKTETAQRVIRFYNERHNALGAFARLAQQFGDQDSNRPMPPLSAASQRF